MVSARMPDWEERQWALTHDLAVRLAIEAASDGTPAVEAAAQCVAIAAVTVAEYRAAVHGEDEGLL